MVRAYRPALLPVLLDLGRRPRLGQAGVLAEFPPRPALPQQVPALVERLFRRRERGVLLSRRQLACGEPGPQLVLSLDQIVDAAEYLFVVHPSTLGPDSSRIDVGSDSRGSTPGCSPRLARLVLACHIIHIGVSLADGRRAQESFRGPEDCRAGLGELPYPWRKV